MGLLDDAIREHLDLKRRRGADPAEIERAEREALGPVRREPSPISELDEPMVTASALVADTPPSTVAEPDFFDEPEVEPAPEPGKPTSGSKRRGLFGRRSHQDEDDLEDDLDGEPPRVRRIDPPETAATPPPVAAPPLKFDSEPPPTELHDALLDDDDDFLTEEPPVPTSRVPEPPAPPAAPPRSASVPGRAQSPSPAASTSPPAATPPPPPAPPAPSEPPARRPPDESLLGETIEYDVERSFQDEEAPDVLEETPEFLQDTPDHDRLWFEQRPPKDFDFDE